MTVSIRYATVLLILHGCCHVKWQQEPILVSQMDLSVCSFQNLVNPVYLVLV